MCFGIHEDPWDWCLVRSQKPGLRYVTTLHVRNPNPSASQESALKWLRPVGRHLFLCTCRGAAVIEINGLGVARHKKPRRVAFLRGWGFNILTESREVIMGVSFAI